jgi:nucleoside-diphosphate-sugar epimerase
MIENKNILITGGRGFIGTHLVNELIKSNNVKIFDIIDGKDIRNINSLRKEFKDIDFVFHLAGLISVEESMKIPTEYIDNNIIGSLNVLKAATENNVKKVIFSSSAAVYGDYLENPKKETMPLIPKSPYAFAKVTIEKLMEYFISNGLDTVSLRFFNVYGPGQKLNSSYASVIPIFISKSLKNEGLVIYGDGAQTRDFIYIDDIINACILSAEKGSGEFNIGSGIPTNINELASLIVGLTKTKSKIIYEKQREGDVIHSLADITKAKKIIGFKPKFDIRSGLKNTIEWFKNQQN